MLNWTICAAGGLKGEWCGGASVIGGGAWRRQDGATGWRREIFAEGPVALTEHSGGGAALSRSAWSKRPTAHLA